jgi:hypothetical protein
LSASLSKSRSRAKPKYRNLEDTTKLPYPTMASHSYLRNKKSWV